MDVFVIFSIVCFVAYLQASIYVFWRNPFIGVNHLFSFMSLLFTIWSLTYIFSYMGEAGRSLFPLPLITITGLAFIPAFYIRIWMSLKKFPKKKSYRNTVFIIALTLGAFFLLEMGRTEGGYFDYHEYTQLNNPVVLFLLKLIFLLINGFIFIQLQKYLFKPNEVSRQILRQMDLMYIVCDEKFRIMDVNLFTHNLLGCEPVAVIGKPLGRFFLKENDLMSHCEAAIKNGHSGPLETFMIDCSENHIPVRIRCHGLIDIYNDMYGVAITGEDMIYEDQLLKDIKHIEHTERRMKTATQRLQFIINQYSQELAEIQKNLYAHYVESTQEIIKSGSEEKEMLVDEIHNRVISNMNLVLLLIQSHEWSHFPAPFNKNLAELSRRVRSMLLVHESLYFSINYSEVDFKGFVYKLVNELKMQYSNKMPIGISFDLCENFLNIQKAIPLALVVNELIINCFLHAFRDSDEQAMIHIVYQNEAGLVQMMVNDNGTGVPEKLITGGYQSAGLLFVETLVKDQLDGSLDINNTTGTKAKIIFSATD